MQIYQERILPEWLALSYWILREAGHCSFQRQFKCPPSSALYPWDSLCKVLRQSHYCYYYYYQMECALFSSSISLFGFSLCSKQISWAWIFALWFSLLKGANDPFLALMESSIWDWVKDSLTFPWPSARVLEIPFTFTALQLNVLQLHPPEHLREVFLFFFLKSFLELLHKHSNFAPFLCLPSFNWYNLIFLIPYICFHLSIISIATDCSPWVPGLPAELLASRFKFICNFIPHHRQAK